jgi:monoamine oxidase
LIRTSASGDSHDLQNLGHVADDSIDQPSLSPSMNHDFFATPLPKRHPRRILVLGAGMSGLTAALELERAGHTVIIVEAQTRPGGRVLTMRDEGGSPIAEAGAGRIPETHTWAMTYIGRMGLETDPLYPDGLSAVIYAQGKRFCSWPRRGSCAAFRSD